MKRNKIIGLGVIAVMMFAFAGCSKEPDQNIAKYNAVMYDRAIDWLKADFREENMTKMPTMQGEIDPAPSDITLVIREQSDFEMAFAEFPPDIDFEREMLVLYFFTDDYNGFGCEITKIAQEDDVLQIYLLHNLAKKNFWGIRPPSLSMPTHRCLVVKLNRVEATATNVELVYET